MIACFLLALAANAQDGPSPDEIHRYVDLMLIELAEGKVDLISEVMQLDEDQGAVFWNHYQDYEIRLFQLGDRRLALQEEFRGELSGGGLNDELARDMASRFFALTKERSDLIEEYHGILAAELSPITAAQFVQLESRFNMVIDLLFAAGTPLMSAALVQDEDGSPVAGEFELESQPLDTAAEVDPPDSNELLLYLCVGLAVLSAGLLIACVRKR